MHNYNFPQVIPLNYEHNLVYNNENNLTCNDSILYRITTAKNTVTNPDTLLTSWALSTGIITFENILSIQSSSFPLLQSIQPKNTSLAMVFGVMALSVLVRRK